MGAPRAIGLRVPATSDARLAARRPALEVLPQATLRVAGWPIETLDAFAAPALAAAARDVAPGERDADFERAYEVELARQRAALREVAGTARFRRMLAIANPQLARRWADPPRRRDLARWQRVEASILNTLMRAVGRPTPNGAWAEVAPVSRSAEHAGLSVRTVPGARLATVDLTAFRVALHALSVSDRYRRGRPLCVEPTLYATATHWRWERERSAVREWDSLPRHPVFDAIVAVARSHPPRCADALLADLKTLVAGDLSAVVDRLVLRGLLRSPLALPVAATDELAVLDAVAAELDPSDARAWAACVGGLQRVCGQLTAAFDAMTPATVERLLAEADGLVADLWRACGVEATPPPVVRLHRRAAVEVTWDDRVIEDVRRAAHEVLAFHACDGGAELLRLQWMSDVVRAFGTDTRTSIEEVLRGQSLPWVADARPGRGSPSQETREELLAAALRDSALHERAAAHCRRWATLTQALAGESEFTVGAEDSGADPGPWGSLLLRLGGSGALWVGQGRPEVAAFRACAERFAETAAAPAAAMARRDELAAADGVALVRLLCDDAEPGDPRCLAPHGAGAAGLAGVCLTVGEDRRGWIERPHDPARYMAVYDGTVAAGLGDRCARLLLAVARGHGWELLSHMISPAHVERTQVQHLPRLRLPGGAVLSPERWTIGGSALARIAALDGSARYLAWRAELDARGVPDVVHVRSDPERPELLMRTDSPLAVDALMRKLAPGARWLSLTELPGDPQAWPIRDAAGGHHLAEIAVTWLRTGP